MIIIITTTDTMFYKSVFLWLHKCLTIISQHIALTGIKLDIESKYIVLITLLPTTAGVSSNRPASVLVAVWYAHYNFLCVCWTWGFFYFFTRRPMTPSVMPWGAAASPSSWDTTLPPCGTHNTSQPAADTHVPPSGWRIQRVPESAATAAVS